MATKLLTKSKTDRKLAGVCGGLAEYFDADATLIRLGVLLAIVISGGFPGLVAYIIAAVIMPEAGKDA
jgi:phage shock protein C